MPANIFADLHTQLYFATNVMTKIYIFKYTIIKRQLNKQK